MQSSHRKLIVPVCVLDESFYPGKHDFLLKKKYSLCFLDTWKFDSVMSLYFDDFTPCRLNWDHNLQKMTFWVELIENYCYYKGSAQFTICELKQVFKRKGSNPRCLEVVCNQMIRDGNLIQEKDFLEKHESLVSWAITMIFVRPLFWAAESFKRSFISNNLDERKAFVVRNVVHRQSKLLLEFLRNNNACNEVITIEQLVEQIADIKIVSKEGLHFVLHDLQSRRLILTDEVPDYQQTQLIKLCPSGEKGAEFTELERIVCKLQWMEKLLSKNLYDKESEISSCLLQVKALLRDGKMQLARSLLHKKHLLEDDLKRIEAALGNIQALLHQISASASDKKILETYKFVSEALKANLATSGMSVDHVYGVIDEVKEILCQEEEISTAIHHSLASTDDDSQFEDELTELMNLSGKSETFQNDPESFETDARSVKTEKVKRKAVLSV